MDQLSKKLRITVYGSVRGKLDSAVWQGCKRPFCHKEFLLEKAVPR